MPAIYHGTCLCHVLWIKYIVVTGLFDVLGLQHIVVQDFVWNTISSLHCLYLILCRTLCLQYVVVAHFVSRSLSSIRCLTMFCVMPHACYGLLYMRYPQCIISRSMIYHALSAMHYYTFLCLAKYLCNSLLYMFFVSRKMFSIPYRTWFCLTCSMHNTLCAT